MILSEMRAFHDKLRRWVWSIYRVPEEKQIMFLPGILEEEEEYKDTPTPRTSTASLANPNDSPVNERR